MRQDTYHFQKEMEGIKLLFSIAPRAKDIWKNALLLRLPVIPTESLSQTSLGVDSTALTSA